MSVGGYKRGIYCEIILDFFFLWCKRIVNEDSFFIGFNVFNGCIFVLFLLGNVF